MGEIEINRQKRTVCYDSNGYRLMFNNNDLQIVDPGNEIFTYQINEIADLFTVQNQLLKEWLNKGNKLQVEDIEFFKAVREMIKL